MLETKSLVLKAHTSENYDKLYQWMNDPELLYFDDDEHEPIQIKSKERVQQSMKRFIESTPEAKKDIIHFAIHKKEDDKFIGYCMIAFIDHFHKRCKFGMSIGAKEEWGKGYGKEVVKGIIHYIFTELHLNRIEVGIYSHNDRSLNLFEGVGFIKEGTLRKNVYKKGQWIDEHIYGLLSEEYMEQS